MKRVNEKAPVLTITCPHTADGHCEKYKTDPKTTLFKNLCVSQVSLGPRFGNCLSQEAAVLAIKEYIRVHELEDEFVKWLTERKKKGGRHA